MAQTIAQSPLVFSTTTAPAILEAYAAHYGIDSKTFVATAECESSFNANAVGDHDSSFGIFQIHLPAHPDITQAEAEDPFWATNWAAQQFAAGKQNEWTCFRELAENSP